MDAVSFTLHLFNYIRNVESTDFAEYVYIIIIEARLSRHLTVTNKTA